MKCVACGKDHWEGDECPRCHFPVYEILGDDLDQSVAQIQAFAKEFQKEYLNDLQLGVVTYQWKDQNGLVKEASHAPVYLRREVFWHPVSSGIRKSWPASRIRSFFRLHWPLRKEVRNGRYRPRFRT